MSEQSKIDAELLPCPHCNGGAEMRLYDSEYFVQCVQCFASTAADHQTEQEAAEKWNRRSLPVGVPDESMVEMAAAAYDRAANAGATHEQAWHDALSVALYTPQPGPDVRALVEALEQIADARETPTLGGPNVLRVIAFQALAAHRQAQRKGEGHG